MKGDVRQAILQSTLELIGDVGIGGVTNRSVARAAGISLGTLTYHFSSQEELLVEALGHFVDSEIDRLAAIAARLEESDLQLSEALHLMQVTIEERAGHRAQVAQLELYVHATRSEALRTAAARCYAAYDRVGAAALTTLGVADAARLAPLLGALVDGFEMRRLAVDDLQVGLAAAVDALVVGLGRSTPADSGV